MNRELRLFMFSCLLLSGCAGPAVKMVLVSDDWVLYEEYYFLEDGTVVWARERDEEVARDRYKAEMFEDRIEIHTPDGTHTLFKYAMNQEVVWVPVQVYAPMTKRPEDERESFLKEEGHYFQPVESGRLGAFK